jgi:DHA2 family methylenomycin A resistance protein-like MFS transporter
MAHLCRVGGVHRLVAARALTRRPQAPGVAAPHAPRAGLVLLTVIVAQILSIASATVIAVALPDLGRDLGAAGSEQQWVVDAFVLVLASLLIAGGVLGDRRGRKPAFMTGVTVFALGSLWCALAPTIELLLAGRVLQALGPALVLPASLAIVSEVYPDPAARARAIGLWGAGSGIGLASGPTLGGAIVDAVGWRGVFAVNVPICLLLLLAGWKVIPHARPPRALVRFDLAGALLLTLSVATLAFVIIEGREAGWTSAVILLAGGGCVAAAIAFVRVERRHAAPLIDLALLRHRGFVAANLGGAGASFAFVGCVVFLSVFLQQVQGRSPGEAGLCLLPLGLGTAALAPFAGRLTARLGARTPILCGLTLATVAMTLLTVRLHVDLGAGTLAWMLGLLGTGIGLSLPAMTVTAVGSVEQARAGMAAAVHNACRQLGQALGVAVVGTIIFAQAGSASDGGRRLLGADATAWTSGLHTALTLCAVLLGVALAGVALFVPRGRPSLT